MIIEISCDSLEITEEIIKIYKLFVSLHRLVSSAMSKLHLCVLRLN